MTKRRLTEEITQAMSEARAETLRIFDLVRAEEELHRSPGGGFRPVIWHLAHMGVFEGYWLLQKLRGEPPLDERYERVFDPIQTPREESKNLPTRREMEDYLSRVRERAVSGLDDARFDQPDPLLKDAYVFRLVLEHELQHQETLLYLLHMLDPSKKTQPPGKSQPSLTAPHISDIAVASPATHVEPRAGVEAPALPGGMVTVAAGACDIGARGDSFAYDNELPRHSRDVPEFKIDRLPTTNEEYARFIAEGGYERREWWSAEGWSWREREGWTCPLYWRRAEKEDDGGGRWTARGLFEEGMLPPTHPVSGVSWYEAEAYARFAGKRLPTEAEWEKAASWDGSTKHKRRFAWGDTEPTPALSNYGRHFWGTTPVGSFPAGASPYGCLDMTGNVWEWTGDAFDGFPGFEPFPYPEYSELWFDGDHRVLKGGSWATSAPVLRNSFRNFFRRHFRIAFAGIRCAAD